MSKPIWGQAAPWFTAEVPSGNRYELSNMAGRFVVLVFLGVHESPEAKIFTQALKENYPNVNRRQILIFGVTSNRSAFEDAGVQSAFQGGRLFYDSDDQIAMQYGLKGGSPDQELSLSQPVWMILDPDLRVWSKGSLGDYDNFLESVHSLPSPSLHTGMGEEQWAPVLVVPRVLSQDQCGGYIDYYHSQIPRTSGFMVTEGGMTREKHNHLVKSRADVAIQDDRLCDQLRSAVKNRIAPMIKRSFQFDATRIERYIIACYTAETEGRFLPHRDNTTAATAHRAFAVTINLNTEDYEGGALRFPEFGNRTYTAPTGGAIVFSCSLLHEALPVTKGKRFATLPFLYGEAESEIRTKNRKYLEE